MGIHAVAVAFVAAVSGSAMAQRAETGLLGIRLFDPSTRVLARFGNPNQIQAITLGGNAQFGGGPGGGGPSAGPGGFGGPPAGFGPPRGGGGGGGGASPALDQGINPFAFGDSILRQLPPIGAEGGGGGGRLSTPGGGSTAPSGPPGRMGPGGGFPGGPPMGGPGGPGGTPPAAGAGTRVTFTRWVYNRKSARYSFIIDRNGRVVQIEAMGMNDRNVRTSQGVGFGSDFRSVITRFGNPDGYEISGDNIFVKFLTRRKVAFQMARLGPNRPQVVIGVVVSAGKS